MTQHTSQLQNPSVGRLFLKYAGPAVLTTVVAALYNTVDRYFLGQYVGTAGLGAASAAFPLMVFGNGLVTLIGESAAGITGRALGRGHAYRAQATFDTALVMGTALALFWLGVILFAAPALLRFSGAGEQLLKDAITYTRIVGCGHALFTALYALNGQARACGKTGVAMMSTVLGVVLNIPFNWLFMAQFKWGIAGAAWATVLGMVVSIGWLAAVFCDRRLPVCFARFRRFVPALSLSILTLGFTPWLVSMSFTLVMFAFNYWVSSLGGELALGAIGVFFAVDSLCYLPMAGVNNGMMPALAYCYGSGRYDQVKHVTLLLLGLGLVWFTLESIASWAFAHWMVAPFVGSDATLGALSAQAVAFGHAGHIGCAFSLAGATVLQACGRAKEGALLALTRELCYVPALLLLPRYFGLQGVWMAFPTVDLCGALIALAATRPLWRKLSTPQVQP